MRRGRTPREVCRTPPRAGPWLFREHLLKLGAVYRACLDGVRPAYILRLLDERLVGRPVESDHLYARLGLALGLLLVVGLPEVVLRLVGLGLALEVLALRRRERLVLVEVHDQRHLGVVEARVDTVLGLLASSGRRGRGSASRSRRSRRARARCRPRRAPW